MRVRTINGILAQLKHANARFLQAQTGLFAKKASNAPLVNLMRDIASPHYLLSLGEVILKIYDFCIARKPEDRLTREVYHALMVILGIRDQHAEAWQYERPAVRLAEQWDLHDYIARLRKGRGYESINDVELTTIKPGCFFNSL